MTLPIDQPEQRDTVTCPVCVRRVTVTRSGAIAQHGHTRAPLHFSPCVASGITVTQARARVNASAPANPVQE